MNEFIKKMQAIVDLAEKEKRSLTEDEQKEFDTLETQANEQKDREVQQKELDERLQKTAKKIEAPFIQTGDKPEYNLANVVKSLAGDKNVDTGLEMEISQDLARNAVSETRGIRVPLSQLFTKAASSGASTGNFDDLTQVDHRWDLMSDLDGAIARSMVAGKLGVQVQTTNERDVEIPIVSTKLAGEVIALDAAMSDAGAPTVSAKSASPVTVACSAEVLRSVMYAHRGTETVMNQVRNAIVETMDAVILGPKASVGGAAPDGIMDLATAATQSSVAVATAWSDLSAVIDELGLYMHDEENPHGFLLNPKFIKLMRATARWSGSAHAVIADGENTVAGKPFEESYELAITSATPDTATALYGKFSEMFMFIHGNSIDLQANPYKSSSWEKGAFGLRSMVDISTILRDVKAIRSFSTDLG